MAIIKVNKNKNYTVMSNYHLKDKNLSLKAKGLLSMMLSLPNDWDYSVDGLVSICKENKTAINSTLKELKDNNYLVVSKDRKANGTFEYVYDIYEQPQTDKPDMEKPDMEKLVMDIPYTENHPLNKYTDNKILNNKLLKNKELYSDDVKSIVDYLNDKLDKHYRPKGATYEIIEARLKDNYTVEDCKKVIDVKTSQWKGTDMEKYLRPETLFNRTKFESYVQEDVSKYDSGNYDVSDGWTTLDDISLDEMKN